MNAWGQEDDLDRMERLKDQARHHQRGRTPTLESQYAYFCERAEDKTLPAAERKLWKQLSEEIATRLGLNAPPSVQEVIW